MDSGHGALVTGVHGLKHVEGFFSADLAENDAVRTHTETVDEQLALANGALPFNVGRAGFKAHDVLLRKLQFGGVFNGDDALALRVIVRENVEEGGFSGASAAGDEEA